MDVNRMLYVVYFRGKKVANRLKKMPVNVSYVSKKLNYALFYGEQNKQKIYLSHLKKVKGFQKLEESPLYNEQLNYEF